MQTESYISSDDSVICQSKQKKKRKSRYSLVPRIMRNDIRNHYSTMFANVCNHMDSDLMSSFFGTFCHKDLNFTMSMAGDMEELSKYEVIKGNEWREMILTSSSIASQFMNNNAMLYPDMTMQLRDTKLHRCADSSESRIESRIFFEATKIYDSSSWSDALHYSDDTLRNSIDNLIVPQKRVCSKTYEDDQNESSEGSLQPNNSNQETIVVEGESLEGKRGFQLLLTPKQQQELISRSPLMAKPVNYSMEGKITMHLDANKRIVKLSFVTTLYNNHGITVRG